MKASHVIVELKILMEKTGKDPEVLGQSAGCCFHGHDIILIETGKDNEKENIVVRFE